jgi:arachidonate 15-lipoxygenase
MALLRPHFKYLLYNNFAGRELLVQPGGFVERILAGELAAGSLEIVKRAYRAFHFDDLHVPSALARRNLVSRTGLPVFPYRDDGLEIWSAIDTWTRAFVPAWYDSDEAVATDVELQRWCRELTSADGAHLAGFPEAFTDRSTLADALTRLVFLAGPQHAAVNYPQNRSMLVIPNMPGAAWAAEPGHLQDMLPPDAAAHAQVEAIWLLTCYQYGRLGDYGSALPDARVQEPLRAFQAHLQTLEQRFVERDRTERERWPWPYLRPSRIPNSTNI